MCIYIYIYICYRYILVLCIFAHIRTIHIVAFTVLITGADLIQLYVYSCLL